MVILFFRVEQQPLGDLTLWEAPSALILWLQDGKQIISRVHDLGIETTNILDQWYQSLHKARRRLEVEGANVLNLAGELEVGETSGRTSVPGMGWQDGEQA